MKHTEIFFRTRAAALHLIASLCIALVVAVLVLFFWFPSPFRDLAGGWRLLGILVAVDVVCGPLLTFLLLNPRKSRRELTLDLSLVAVLQLIALGYGLYSIALARPVAVVYEVDRFVAVARSDLNKPDFLQAEKKYWNYSIFSKPMLIGTRNARSSEEFLESIELSTRGIEPSTRVNWWQDYDLSRPQVIQRMKRLSLIYENQTLGQKEKIDSALPPSRSNISKLYFLPLTSYQNLDGWIVLLDGDANIVGYAPVDGFQ